MLMDTVLWCSWKFSLLSKIIPRCFCHELCSTELLLKSSTKWLAHWYKSRKSGPKIDTWVTPASVLAQDEAWTFTTNVSLKFLRKLLTSSRRFPDIPFWFKLEN